MMRYAAHVCVCLGGEGRMGTCSGSCTGSSLWARARAARSGSRRGCESEHTLLARYFTSRASRLRLALGNAALAALAAAGSRSGLVLWTRARYSGLALGLGLVLVLGARARPHALAMRSQQSSGLACFPYSAACAGRSVASCFTRYTRSGPGAGEPMRWTASPPP